MESVEREPPPLKAEGFDGLGYDDHRFTVDGVVIDNRREAEEAAAAAVSDGGGSNPISLLRLIFACTVAGGVQYGWALQLSLLTPYVQTLGISHSLTSLMWLCGPIAGFVVQPIVGYYSDRCTSRFGRRRPFIFSGCLLICIAVTVIGFSSDIGSVLGDTKEHCSVYHGNRVKAALVFVLGFWALDFSNNAVQGPARAMMADLSSQHGCNTANAIFCSWMAVGNILGYLSGSSGNWHKWFPFLLTKSCCEACANLKGAFLVAVLFLLSCLTITLIVAKEVTLKDSTKTFRLDGNLESGGQILQIEDGHGPFAIFRNFITALKSLPPGMTSVLLVTSLTWLSWFPFILYDTDWMGREIYHGNPKGTPAQVDAYEKGVRKGAFGLLLNSVILGITSLLIEPMCRMISAKLVWASSNFMMCIGMTATTLISVWSVKDFQGSIQHAITADSRVMAAAVVLFLALGVPLAILYSIPFAYTAQLVVNEGGGQGLCTGILNIAIVVPQVIVALGAGPWDSLFKKGGNIPAFALAAVVALVCGLVGLFMLPRFSRHSFKTSGLSGFH